MSDLALKSCFVCLFLEFHVLNFSGKSGHVGRRFASSLGSIGLASHFIHATDFVHGDLGKT